MVKLLLSPGLRFGSPVSPMLLASSILSAPVATGAGGSPESVMGIWSNGVSVLMTTSSWSIVPRFLTLKVTSPAGALSANGVTAIGPSRPLVSVNATSMGAATAVAVPPGLATATPPSPAPAGLLGGEHAPVSITATASVATTGTAPSESGVRPRAPRRRCLQVDAATPRIAARTQRRPTGIPFGKSRVGRQATGVRGGSNLVALGRTLSHPSESLCASDESIGSCRMCEPSPPSRGA